ncbi:MAG: penicillin acylase family protein [Mycobacteriales bacterium]
MPNFFDDESFGIPPGQVVRTERPAPGVAIYRDVHDVPHIYATTVTGAAFGTGYAQAEDTFTEVGIPKPGGQGAPAVITHDIYLTRHGIVQGWTTADGGKPVAVVLQGSTYNHEVDSGIGFLRWASPALTHGPRSWMKGAEDINYTFN